MNQPSSRPKHRSGWGALIASILLVVVSAILWLNRQYVIDSISFWRYQPSSAVASVTDRVNLTDSGKFLFYASQPAIDDSTTFNKVCDNKEQQAAILGCYVANRIYIYNVRNAQLDGIKEVTAAHEMLHVVYQRLSDGEKADVDRLVDAEYKKLQNNPDFADRMAFYARTEPGERNNELHSIIGTEVASVSPELEAHYKKYFNDRSKIVGYYTSYHKAFTTLEERTKELGDQLDELNSKIKSASAAYNTDASQLKSDIAAFNARADNSGFTSQAQFNKERVALVARVAKLDSDRTTINTLVAKYNDLREQYNETVTQSNELYKSIDSSLTPAPQV